MAARPKAIKHIRELLTNCQSVPTMAGISSLPSSPASYTYTYTNIGMPVVYKSTDRMWCRPANSVSINSLLYECAASKPYVVDTDLADIYSAPVILRCSDINPSWPERMGRDTYVLAYGRLYYLLVPFNRDTLPDRIAIYNNGVERDRLLRHLQTESNRVICGIKIIYKLPPIYTAEGSLFMLKIYISGKANLRPTCLIKYLSSYRSSDGQKLPLRLETSAVYHSGIYPHTGWLISRDATAVGEIQINTDGSGCCVLEEDRGDYRIVRVHHRRIRFITEGYCHVSSSQISNYAKTAYRMLQTTYRLDYDRYIADDISISTYLNRIYSKDELFASSTTERTLYYTFQLYKKDAIDDVFSNLVNLSRRSTRGLEYAPRTEAARIVCYALLKRALKHVWYKIIRPAHRSAVMEMEKNLLFTRVATAARVLAFDIETGYPGRVPAETDGQILCIHAILYDHVRDTPYESRSFVYWCEATRGPVKDAAVDMARLELLSREHFPIRTYVPIQVVFATNEHDLIDKFFDYARSCRVSTITYFNGHKFDLPVLMSRSNMECNITFTYRRDEVRIQAQRAPKMTDSKKISVAAGVNSVGNGDGTTDRRRCDIHTDAGRRRIHKLSMQEVSLVDMMQEVAASPVRGISLAAAAEIVKEKKLSHPDVEYSNIARTYLTGDMERGIVYCMADAYLVCLLDKYRKMPLYYATLSSFTYRPPRHLLRGQPSRMLYSARESYGYRRDVVSPAAISRRDDIDIWSVNHEFRIEEDFCRLTNLGGRTIHGMSGLYSSHTIPTLDYNSQYPSIMIERNICPTTQLSLAYIQANNLVLDRDYIAFRLDNVRPSVTVDATIERCGQKRKRRPAVSYEPVTTTIYYATRDYFEGISAEYAATQCALRKRMQSSLKEALAAKSMRDADIYQTMQLIVKLLNNAQYGYVSLHSSIIGGSVTQRGREQNSAIAEILVSHYGMYVINADTDSVMVIDPNTPISDGLAKTARHYYAYGGGDKQEWLTNVYSVRDLFTRIIGRYESIQYDLNNGQPGVFVSPYVPPCKIEVEKTFLFQYISMTKQYLGEIFLQSGQQKLHVVGLACKKADRTALKRISQYMLLLLLLNRDYIGLVNFIREYSTAVIVHLRAHELSQLRVDAMCLDDTVPIDVRYKKIADIERSGSEQRERRNLLRLRPSAAGDDDEEDYDTVTINDSVLVSIERVGDVEQPKTAAAKRAVCDCIRKNEPTSTAPMLITMRRSSAVQSSNILRAIIERLLEAPIESAAEQKRMIEHERLLSQSSASYRRLVTRRARLDEKRQRDESTVRPLTLTHMEQEYIAPRSSVDRLSESLRRRLMTADHAIDSMERTIERERKEVRQNKQLTAFRLPDDNWTYTDKERLRAVDTINQLATENIEEVFSIIPLYRYDEDVCYTCPLPPGNNVWHRIGPGGMCIDFWAMYMADDDRRTFRFYELVLTGDNDDTRLFYQIRKLEEESSVDAVDTITVNRLALYKRNRWPIVKDKSYKIDIVSYARQTMSTPYVIQMINGDLLLTNTITYAVGQNNRFSFIASQLTFRNFLRCTTRRIGFQPSIATNAVHVYVDDDEINPIGIFDLGTRGYYRDDGRSCPVYVWDDDLSIRWLDKGELDNILSVEFSKLTALGTDDLLFRFSAESNDRQGPETCLTISSMNDVYSTSCRIPLATSGLVRQRKTHRCSLGFVPIDYSCVLDVPISTSTTTITAESVVRRQPRQSRITTFFSR